MTKDIPLCNFCEHLRYSKKGYYCRAFGGGGRKIPAEIISNQFFHNKPFPGDNGIHYFKLTSELRTKYEEMPHTVQTQDFLGAVRDVLDEIVGRGGPGSGNFGHAGRPGEVGGSGEGGETVPSEETPGEETPEVKPEGVETAKVYTDFKEASDAFEKY